MKMKIKNTETVDLHGLRESSDATLHNKASTSTSAVTTTSLSSAIPTQLTMTKSSSENDIDKVKDEKEEDELGKEAMKMIKCNERLRSLTRLACMVTLVVKASGTPSTQDPSSSSSSTTQAPQQVSVDVVNHLIQTDLPGLLTTALSSIPLGNSLACDAINAILDPLEMITRPKLLANLDKLNDATIPNNKVLETPGPNSGSGSGSGSGSRIQGTSSIGNIHDTVAAGITVLENIETSEEYHRLPENSEIEGDFERGEEVEEEESASGMVTMASGPSLMREDDTGTLAGTTGITHIITSTGTGSGTGTATGTELNDRIRIIRCRSNGSSVHDQSSIFSTRNGDADADGDGDGNQDSDGSDTGVDLDLSLRGSPGRGRERVNLDLASGNTNARTSRNVFNSSISSATLPSDEGLFGDDDEDNDDGNDGEQDEEADIEVECNDCGDDDDDDGVDVYEEGEDEEFEEDDEDDFDVREDEDEDEDEDVDEEMDDDNDDDNDDDDDDDSGEGLEVHRTLVDRERARQTRRHFNSPAIHGYRTERVERARR